VAKNDGISVSLRSWGYFFPPPDLDPSDVTAKVFLLMSGLVGLQDPTPDCPTCGGPTHFQEDQQRAFGWQP